MFGIGFSELVLIGLVALLVLGPERLPGAARTAGLWIGRLKRSFNTIRQEVEREIGADEIRRQLHNENLLSWEKREKQTDSSNTPATSGEVTTGPPAPTAGPTLPPEPKDTPLPPRTP
ncbi:sec-independent protein translocase protein TatB [Pseudomonas duriflava]|uniref:Sec-independent protein translocase protein TatB n=1 Tax=Pseudomonas duriflava TaxID=459528 RepID=A0A562QBL6_9PSED|nr:Sec-independent protein translocase protein TatB [Pseudomonas duriflava]TWI54155.1 sec-independent protein translocase protein TatB [Pseudomonas duriflava]